MKHILILLLTVFFLSPFTPQNVHSANNTGSLYQVATVVADALAANDATALEQHTCTSDEAYGWVDKDKMTKAEFLQRIKEKKKMIHDSWREIRDGKILVEQVVIKDVKIKKVNTASNGRLKMIGIVVPSFKIDGKPTPVPMLRMLFLQINGEWKYIQQ